MSRDISEFEPAPRHPEDNTLPGRATSQLIIPLVLSIFGAGCAGVSAPPEQTRAVFVKSADRILFFCVLSTEVASFP